MAKSLIQTLYNKDTNEFKNEVVKQKQTKVIWLG